MAQRRGARYVTNDYHRTSSVTRMMEDIGWSPLAHRRKCARLAMLYKIQHNLVDLQLDSVKANTGRRTRYSHSQRLVIPQSKHDFRKYAFGPRTVSDWNNLPEDVANAPSLTIFRGRISTP